MNKIKTYITKYTPELKEKILAAWGNSDNLPPVQKVDKIHQIVEEFGVSRKSLIGFLSREKVYTASGDGDPVEEAVKAVERCASFFKSPWEKALDSLRGSRRTRSRK